MIARTLTIPATDLVSTHEIILEQLHVRGLSRYWLANHPIVTCSPSTVYRFLAGDGEVGSRAIDEMLNALRMRVVGPSAS